MTNTHGVVTEAWLSVESDRRCIRTPAASLRFGWRTLSGVRLKLDPYRRAFIVALSAAHSLTPL